MASSELEYDSSERAWYESYYDFAPTGGKCPRCGCSDASLYGEWRRKVYVLEEDERLAPGPDNRFWVLRNGVLIPPEEL